RPCGPGPGASGTDRVGPGRAVPASSGRFRPLELRPLQRVSATPEEGVADVVCVVSSGGHRGSHSREAGDGRCTRSRYELFLVEEVAAAGWGDAQARKTQQARLVLGHPAAGGEELRRSLRARAEAPAR